MKKICLILVLLSVMQATEAQTDYTISSPDDRVEVTVSVNRKKRAGSNRFKLKIVSDDRILLEKKIDMLIKSAGHRYKFRKSTVYDVSKEENGRFSSMTIATDIGVTMEVWAYNDSVCYRYFVKGHKEEYQVTAVAPIFPHDRPQAIIGTYTQDLVLPWHTLDIDHEKEKEMNLPFADPKRNRGNVWGRQPKTPKLEATRPIEEYRRVLSWKDAPVTVTAGLTVSDYHGCTWHRTSKQDGAVIDLTYKYVYGAFTFMPCQSLAYIYWGETYWPFEHTMGWVHSWNLGGRLGASLPIQWGYNILNITPYCAFTRMSLTQHRERPNYPSYEACHTMIGPGLKIQLSYPEQLVVGLGYELQFFHDRSAPKSTGIWSLSIGYMF